MFLFHIYVDIEKNVFVTHVDATKNCFCYKKGVFVTRCMWTRLMGDGGCFGLLLSRSPPSLFPPNPLSLLCVLPNWNTEIGTWHLLQICMNTWARQKCLQCGHWQYHSIIKWANGDIAVYYSVTTFSPPSLLWICYITWLVKGFRKRIDLTVSGTQMSTHSMCTVLMGEWGYFGL